MIGWRKRILHLAERDEYDDLAVAVKDQKMNTEQGQLIAESIETFVKGHAITKSLTHPYEAVTFGPIWCLRDGPRKNPKHYRKEEWIAYNVAPTDLIRVAQSHARGRHFLGVLVDDDDQVKSVRDQYRRLGYRLLVTEFFFVHHLTRIPRRSAEAEIVRLDNAELAQRYAQQSRTRPLPERFFQRDSPWRQYLALVDDQVAGWVCSISTERGNWCSNLFVRPGYRRRGIASALLSRLLRDDRQARSSKSVLLSTHTGAQLYPTVGYQRIGTLLILAPITTNPS